MESYSIILLKETVVDSKENKQSKVFEECIVVARLSHNFFSKSKEEKLEYFQNNCGYGPYKNINGEDVYEKVHKIIDIYKISDPIECKDFTEIYSKFLIFDEKTSADDVVKKY